MRSRMIYAFAAKTPNRRGEKAASRQRSLIPGVADGDPERSGIAAGSRTSPAKVLSRGHRVRQPLRDETRQVTVRSAFYVAC